MSPIPAWHFREMDRGEINVDPVHDEFFKAQDLADALVREAIQNSLDARRGRSTVRVRFRFAVDDDALPAETAERYLLGLGSHLSAVAPHLSASLPDLETPMPYLVVEDSGTRGLTGDPGSDPELDEHEESRNDFYYFWRNVGRSGKGEVDRGRWGLGKAVFSVSSRIRTMFGLTLRADDERRLLVGQSVLRTHVLGKRRHAPYGFFASVGRDDFPSAVENDAAIDRFISDFGLSRTEPGLSIVIPWHREDDLRFERIITAVIEQYFYPIVRGDLAVTVEENGVTETISSRTIDDVAARFTAESPVAKLCALTRWSLALEDGDWIRLAEPPASSAPRWRDDSIPARSLDALRARFEAGDRLAFRIGVAVKRRRSRPAATSFDVVLERDPELKRGEHHFIRRGITIPEVRSDRARPVRALLVAEEDALSTFLGDAENPAHSDWSERNDRIRNLYDQGASTLRYVKNAIDRLASLLTAPPAGRAPDLLAGIFSVAIASDAQERGATGGRGSESTAPAAAPAPKSAEQRMKITPLTGGFTLRGSGNLRDVGATFVAQVAYRTRTGNPFHRYSELDFVIGRDGVELGGEGATVRLTDGNRFEILPARPDFQLALTGFDARRDLVIRVTRKDDDAAETELH